MTAKTSTYYLQVTLEEGWQRNIARPVCVAIAKYGRVVTDPG